MKVVIDTNAGPLVTREFADIEEAKEYAAAHVPLLREEGHSLTWTHHGAWHVGNVFLGGEIVHSFALRPIRSDPLNVIPFEEEDED